MLLTSGLHVPFILLLSGYIICQSFQRVVKTHDIFTIPMMKKATMYMALSCDIALILLVFAVFMLYGFWYLFLLLLQFITNVFVYGV